MKCPACESKLREIQAGGIKVDVCDDGCAGVWFDWSEIKHFDEEHELDAAPILAFKKKSGIVRNSAPLPCPKCESEVLVRQYFDPKSEVEIDLCWSCSGVWLDCGELETIRGQFKTEEERQRAGDQFVDALLKEHFKAMSEASQDKITKLEADNKNILKALFNSFRQLFDPMEDGLMK